MNDTNKPKPGRDGSWGPAARDWAAAQEGTMSPIFKAVLARVGVGPGKAVLDVGCGTGLFCLLASRMGAEVAGIDASPGQIEVARERLPNADLRQGEMDELPFDSGVYDLVSCCNALQYSTDTLQALREMIRVAKPGATVSILTSGRTGPHGMRAFFAGLSALREQKPEATPPPPRPLFADPDALGRYMAEAGLTLYEEKEVECDWDYPNLETALKGGLSFAPGVRAIRDLGKDAVYEAVAAELEQYKTASGGYHIPNMARYVLGRVKAN